MTGLIAPLYSYPGEIWRRVVKAKLAHPEVPFIAVINPNSGPGSAFDTNYAKEIYQLQRARVVVLGYVYTSYGKRATNSILLEIDSYSRWYHVDGVLFDEMSNAAGYETYYSDLGRVAKSYGCKFIFGNPGTMTLSSFIGTVDNLVVYENHGLPSPASLRSLTMGMDKDNFSYIAHGVSQLDSYSLARTLRFVSYLYVTEANPQEAYCTLPEYFDVLVARLDRTNVGKINEDGSSFHRLFEKLFQR